MVNYLRLSVTDRCSMDCVYCTPNGRDRFLPRTEILSFEEIKEAVTMLSQTGIEYVRITGGEPLQRDHVEILVGLLRQIPSLKEINMTTNGVLLKAKLPALRQAGLDRLNISLNTFKKDRYKILTGLDVFHDAWASIKEVIGIPDLHPKINTVIIKGINDDEVEAFVDFAIGNKVDVRFIEYFPTNNNGAHIEFMPNHLIRERIEKRFGKLIPDKTRGNGPAMNYKINQSKGRVGFIDTNTGNFCASCNRLRLTAGGKLHPCLFSPVNIDLKAMIRGGFSRGEIKKHIECLVSNKQDHSKKKMKKYEFIMSEMGG